MPAATAPRVLRADGGVEVHLLATSRFHTALLLWVVEAPLDGGRTARALLPDLLTRGTARHPGMADLAARCEELFNAELLASVSAHGPRQVLRLGIETISQRHAGGQPLFEQAVDLLAETLHEPPLVDGRFREDHVAQERTNLARAIDSLADDKGLLAYRRLIEAMHAGTPWALHSWGAAAEARALDEAAVHRAWDDLRERLPARLFVVGDVTEEQALDVARRLSRVPRRQAPAAPSPPPPLPDRPVQEFSERQPLAQSKLALGFRLLPSACDWPAATLMGTVLGGGSHSRLFKRVREKESLAYGCSASVQSDSGTLVVQAGIDEQAAPRVREVVLEELQALARDGVGADELQLSRRMQVRRLTALRDAPGELMSFRLHALMTGRPVDLDEAIAALLEVRPDEIARVAAATRLDTVFLLAPAR